MPRSQIEHKRRAPFTFKYSDALKKGIRIRQTEREGEGEGKRKKREKNEQMIMEGKEERREDEKEGNLGSTCSF